MESGESTHFYIDNAPPYEVMAVLRVLAPNHPVEPSAIAGLLSGNYGVAMQKDLTYSPRRLFDLGLAVQSREGGKTLYALSERGARVQGILSMDAELAADVLHYLHYSGYTGNPTDRKLFWSYRRCCEMTWQAGATIPNARLAADIQAEMKDTFEHIDFTAQVGGRLDAVGVGRVITWLRALTPSPVPEKGGPVEPRRVERLPLVVLALDDTYRARQIRFGDPVLLTAEFVQQIAGVFFLDTTITRDLLQVAPKLTKAVTMMNTLAGPAITLHRPYTIEDL